MLASHRAVDNCCPCSLSYPARGADRNRAIDDGQSRLVQSDVPGRLRNKIMDLEWVADVHYVYLLDSLNRSDIDPNGVMIFRYQFKDRLPYFPKSNDGDLTGPFHRLFNLPEVLAA
jgi:hypothetical protein